MESKKENEKVTNFGTTSKPETGKELLTLDKKRFCTWCHPADPLEKGHDFHVFVDWDGNGWRCAIPYQCDHAIIMDGAIYSCRFLTLQLNERAREFKAASGGQL